MAAFDESGRSTWAASKGQKLPLLNVLLNVLHRPIEVTT